MTAYCCLLYECTRYASWNIRLALAHLPNSKLEACKTVNAHRSTVTKMEERVISICLHSWTHISNETISQSCQH